MLQALRGADRCVFRVAVCAGVAILAAIDIHRSYGTFEVSETLISGRCCPFGSLTISSPYWPTMGLPGATNVV